MLEKIDVLPFDEQLIVIKEMRDCIQDLLHQASGMAFNYVRLSQGLSIGELANHLNISSSRLSLIEQGDILPTAFLIEKLTQLFQLNKTEDTEGNITLTYHEIFFASIQSITFSDLQEQKLKH